MYDDYEYIDSLQDPNVIQAIWEKGIIVEGYNASLYRKDAAGAWIARDAFGDISRDLGWEIDHVYPESLGGDNRFVNLRPMNWKNNRSKSDQYPQYIAAVTSKDNKNIVKETSCKVSYNLQSKLKEIYAV